MFIFEWNNSKNDLNIKKHGISFSEARTVFFDEQAILFDDPEHSKEEERFLLIGMSEKTRVCIVCHCYRKSETVIRIISARKATKKEVQRYVEGI
ncbi:MAG: BrnT family toxin [Firmicutes bacterium]|nr:BrnT family toxin [Bacillota bacterium]